MYVFCLKNLFHFTLHDEVMKKNFPRVGDRVGLVRIRDDKIHQFDDLVSKNWRKSVDGDTNYGEN